MLKRQTWMLLMLLIALVAFTGCSDDDDPVTPPKDHFVDVAAAVTAELNNGDVTPQVVSATKVYEDLTSKSPMYTIVDVRSQDHYDAGHIEGAIHSSLSTLVADLADGTIPTSDDKTLMFVCYTGQSAGHAKIAANLLGHNAKSMGFGMSSWSPDVAGSKWSESGTCADMLASPETENQNGGLVDNAYPSLDEGLEARVSAMLANGFKGIPYTPDLDKSETYFLLNYWGEPDYLGNEATGTTGHIPGAFQFTPYSSLDIDAMLKNLPTDKQIIVYCWTGQHSSQVTAALNVMGYNAMSLKFGANSLMHTSLKGHKWSDTNSVMDYPLIATPEN